MKNYGGNEMSNKVLFVLQSIGYGGSMTSLINLQYLLHNEKDIRSDMLFMDPDGALLSEAKKAGNVLKSNLLLKAVTQKRTQFKGAHGVFLWILRMYCYILGKINKCSAQEMAYRIAAKKYSDKYDYVVAFQESTATNFTYHINAKKKITWVHNDLCNVSKIYADKLPIVYSQYDKIVCVSDAAVNNFIAKSNIPDVDNKILRIYNSFRPSSILEKATEIAEDFEQNSCMKFVSVGRVVQQKSFLRAIETANRLRKEGFKFVWYIIGSGEQEDMLKEAIDTFKLQNVVKMIGARINPYSYISKCDIMVITSEFEAHPMVANEALILHVPVISTNYESAGEVVQHNYNGLLCNNSTEGVYEAVKRILSDHDLFVELKNNADSFEYDNQSILNQLKDLFDEKENFFEY